MMSFAIKCTIKAYVFVSTEMIVHEMVMIVKAIKGAP